MFGRKPRRCIIVAPTLDAGRRYCEQHGIAPYARTTTIASRESAVRGLSGEFDLCIVPGAECNPDASKISTNLHIIESIPGSSVRGLSAFDELLRVCA